MFLKRYRLPSVKFALLVTWACLCHPASGGDVSTGITTLEDVSLPVDDFRFVGFYYGATTIQMVYAAGQWLQTKPYADDCLLQAACSQGTRCANGVVTYNNGKQETCSPGFTCATITIYDTSPPSEPSALNIKCRQNWSATTLYRSLATGLPSSTISKTALSPMNISSLLSLLPSPTGSASLPSPTESLANTTPSTEESPVARETNAGVLAGAVVGSVVGAGAMVAGVLWWWLRRRATKDAGPEDDGNVATLHNTDSLGIAAEMGVWPKTRQSRTESKQEMFGDCRWPAVELSATAEPVELPTHYELHASPLDRQYESSDSGDTMGDQAVSVRHL